MARTRSNLIIIAIFIFTLLVIAYVTFNYHSYLLLSFIILASIILSFFLRFEWKEIQAREMVLLAMLAAIAAVSRVPFAGIPSVQPTSFVIIMTGLVFGAESGFLVGAVAAVVSNIFLGQGPWTPWQMFAWGLMGMSAGLIKDYRWMSKLWVKAIFVFVWGYFFGWIMNMWIIVSNIENVSWAFLASVYISSIGHDLAHALSNVFFFLLFYKSWTKILIRFKTKYGLFSST